MTPPETDPKAIIIHPKGKIKYISVRFGVSNLVNPLHRALIYTSLHIRGM